MNQIVSHGGISAALLGLMVGACTLPQSGQDSEVTTKLEQAGDGARTALRYSVPPSALASPSPAAARNCVSIAEI